MARNGNRTRAAARAARLLGSVVALCVLVVPAGAGAQAAMDTVGTRAGGAQLHPVVGLMGGTFDVHRGPRLEVLGARAGLGFGELFRLTGFYWRSVDTGERELLDGRGWGGEGQLNLQAGFGLTPFVTAGVARVRADIGGAMTGDEPGDDRTAAILGAGLMVPLGPIQITVGARDYLFGLSGLDDTVSGETTHNWLYSVGVDAALRRARARAPVVVARAPRPGAVDTVWMDARGQPVAPDTVRVGAAALEPREPGVRNYQSDRSIQVPIPVEGSITLRYGPEPAVAAATTAGTTQAPAPTVAAQPPQITAAPAPALSDAAMQRIIDGTVAALLPRLDARDAERQRQLRADLDAALTAQREVVRELVRQELAGLQADPPAAARPADPGVAPRAPPGVAPDRAEEIQRAADRLAAAREELARIEAGRATPAPAEAPSPRRDIRPALADLAARHPPLLTTAELDRGPALVVTDIAFTAGSALVDERARAVLGAVAALLGDVPRRPIFIQGHSDGAGPEVRSQQLSELRAEVVRSLLVQAGVDPARVHAIGFGAGRPIATNETAAGRALNRRVEIVMGETDVNGGTP